MSCTGIDVSARRCVHTTTALKQVLESLTDYEHRSVAICARCLRAVRFLPRSHAGAGGQLVVDSRQGQNFDRKYPLIQSWTLFVLVCRARHAEAGAIKPPLHDGNAEPWCSVRQVRMLSHVRMSTQEQFALLYSSPFSRRRVVSDVIVSCLCVHWHKPAIVYTVPIPTGQSVSKVHLFHST